MKFWLVILLLIVPGAASADSWALPERQSYFSADRSLRFTVTPRALRGALGYFEDKVAGKEPAGQDKEGVKEATGKLERLDSNGTWIAVWERPLLNEVAPVNALVENSGRYVVTFDNWHSVGLGDNVVVIYGADGRLIRSMTLTDIVPEDYVQILPRSVSSLWWHGTDRISGDALVLQIVVPEGKSPNGKQDFVDVTVDLATGQRRPLKGPPWDKAIASSVP